MKYHFSAPGIEASFKKYPVAQKAYERTRAEHCAAFFMIHGDEAGVEGEHVIQIVDETVDGTQEEKEALMIAAMYITAPETLSQDKTDMVSLYGPAGAAAAALVGEVQQASQRKDVSPPAAVARVVAVVNVLLFDAMQDLPRQTIPAAALKEQEKANKLLLINLNAPRLEKLYTDLSDKLFKAQAPQKKAPKGPSA